MTGLFYRVGRRYQEAPPAMVMESARDAALAAFNAERPVLLSQFKAREFVKERLRGLEHEVFGVVFLDTRHKVIEYAELFRGTIDGSAVHPREVVKEVLSRNAAAVILVHNHPSGNPEPSIADENITIRLRDALALIEVRVLDHLIVAGEFVTSLAERGKI